MDCVINDVFPSTLSLLHSFFFILSLDVFLIGFFQTYRRNAL